MHKNISLHKSSLCGCRPSNEDVERYKINLSNSGGCINQNYAPIDFFVVCDGHGGKEVAEFVAPELEKYLTAKEQSYPLHHNNIVKIYNIIQRKLVNHPQKIATNCGCTALVLLRFIDECTHKKNIQIINIGDCRAVLSRKGFAIPLSKDHKPFWSDEKKRIDMVNKKYGTNEKIKYDTGDWRIGDLSVSRSFGDLDNVPFVTHIPDSFCYELNDDDEFVVLACDGVFDVMENHDVINFIRDNIQNNHIDLYEIPGKYNINDNMNIENIARRLANFVIAKGSTDNVSVLIIFFGKH